MDIRTSNNLYCLASAISEERCVHYTQLYEFAKEHFTDAFTYKALQVESAKHTNIGGSAIRTFIPMFKLLGFVNYEDHYFTYTKDGDLFYMIQRTLMDTRKSNHPNKQAVIEELEEARLSLFWKGTLNMLQCDDTNSKKLKVMLQLLNDLHELRWDEYLYAIDSLANDDSLSIQDVASDLLSNRKKDTVYNFFIHNKSTNKFDPLPSTATSYLKSLLLNNKLIDDYDVAHVAKASLSFKEFFSLANI